MNDGSTPHTRALVGTWYRPLVSKDDWASAGCLQALSRLDVDGDAEVRRGLGDELARVTTSLVEASGRSVDDLRDGEGFETFLRLACPAQADGVLGAASPTPFDPTVASDHTLCLGDHATPSYPVESFFHLRRSIFRGERRVEEPGRETKTVIDGRAMAILYALSFGPTHWSRLLASVPRRDPGITRAELEERIVQLRDHGFVRLGEETTHPSFGFPCGDAETLDASYGPPSFADWSEAKRAALQRRGRTQAALERQHRLGQWFREAQRAAGYPDGWLRLTVAQWGRGLARVAPFSAAERDDAPPMPLARATSDEAPDLTTSRTRPDRLIPREDGRWSWIASEPDAARSILALRDGDVVEERAEGGHGLAVAAAPWLTPWLEVQGTDAWQRDDGTARLALPSVGIPASDGRLTSCQPPALPHDDLDALRFGQRVERALKLGPAIRLRSLPRDGRPDLWIDLRHPWSVRAALRRLHDEPPTAWEATPLTPGPVFQLTAAE